MSSHEKKTYFLEFNTRDLVNHVYSIDLTSPILINEGACCIGRYIFYIVINDTSKVAKMKIYIKQGWHNQSENGASTSLMLDMIFKNDFMVNHTCNQ